MTLGPREQARLAKILDLARRLESAWPQIERATDLRLQENPTYQELKAEISACGSADAPELQRLVERARHLHPEISLAHFYGCIVPFERLAGRSLRDDEFLVTEGDVKDQTLKRVPLKVIVENLRSAFNVGALFRTSECLGISEILLCGYTPGPDDGKTARTAMGTSELVPWRRFDRAPAACAELRREGYQILALETAESAVSLHEMLFTPRPLALVIGNERFGLETDTLAAVDGVCRIPTRGVKNSMNVGVAFGIAAFEWLRQFEEVKQ